MDENVREDFVSVEAGTSGIHLYGEHPVGEPAMIVIPWDQGVEVSRRIVRFVRNHGDRRGAWQSSRQAKGLRLTALLILTALALMVLGHLAGEALPLGN